MDLEQFIEDFEEAVEDVEVGSLRGETNYKALAVWDSLAILTVIAMVDAEYDVRLKANVLKSCETLAELFALVSAQSRS
jgi:acyl carrier protein